jgi:hypothetical protein
VIDNRDSNAFHEAGHVAAAHFLGLSLKYVTICRSDGWYGRTELEPPDLDCTGRRSHRFLLELSGAAAEKRYDKERLLPASHQGSYYYDAAKNDYEAVLLCLAEGENIHGFEAEADSFVDKHWSVIRAVAEALLARETLLGDEVHEIIDGVRV